MFSPLAAQAKTLSTPRGQELDRDPILGLSAGGVVASWFFSKDAVSFTVVQIFATLMLAAFLSLIVFWQTLVEYWRSQWNPLIASNAKQRARCARRDVPQLRRRRSIRITCRYFARYGRSPRLATSFLAAKRTASERLVYGSAATNSTPSLAEVATIHSTVYSPRVAIGDGLRSIDIYRNTA